MVSLAVNGELASVLGSDYVKTDIYLRTWKIRKTANDLVKGLQKFHEDNIDEDVEDKSSDENLDSNIVNDAEDNADIAGMQIHEGAEEN